MNINKSKIKQEQARKELENIEFQKATFKSKFMREQSIWYEIAMQINSHTGENKNHWIRVAKLYKKKYR